MKNKNLKFNELSKRLKISKPMISYWLRKLGYENFSRYDNGDLMASWKIRMLASVQKMRGIKTFDIYNRNPNWFEETALCFSFFPRDKNKMIILPEGVRAYRNKKQLQRIINNYKFFEIVEVL